MFKKAFLIAVFSLLGSASLAGEGPLQDSTAPSKPLLVSLESSTAPSKPLLVSSEEGPEVVWRQGPLLISLKCPPLLVSREPPVIHAGSEDSLEEAI